MMMTPKLDENCTKKKTIDQNYELQCKNLRYYPKESKHLKRKKMKKWGIVQKFQGYFKLKKGKDNEEENKNGNHGSGADWRKKRGKGALGVERRAQVLCCTWAN